jgi:hypothetical protein
MESSRHSKEKHYYLHTGIVLLIFIKNFLQEKAVEATKQKEERRKKT